MNWPPPRLCIHTEVVESADLRNENRRDDTFTHWQCQTCGSFFPLVGDTDQWAPELIVGLNEKEVGFIQQALGRWTNPGVAELLAKLRWPG